MTDSRQNDPIWQTAVDWVLRTHERSLYENAAAALAAWLDHDSMHRATYEEAARVWLLTGLVPQSGGDGSNSSA